jgi:hypothetical protein
MQVITPNDIRTIPEFSAIRDDMRRRVIALKKYRRLFLGENVTLLFENRETMLWQIHEMVRAEGLTDTAAIAHECDTYSQLLPQEHSLSATLFIELPQDSNIRQGLDRLLGLDEHTYMEIDGQRLKAHFDPSQYNQERISSVHYLNFIFTEELKQHFISPKANVIVGFDHPNYTCQNQVQGETLRSLVDDFRTP